MEDHLANLADRVVEHTNGDVLAIGRQTLTLQETRGKAVIAVKFDVIERSRDSVPAGHRGSFDAPYMSLCDHDYISKSEGLADQYDFNLNGSSGRELLRTEKIDARRADIPCDESDGMMFSRAVCGPKTER